MPRLYGFAQCEVLLVGQRGNCDCPPGYRAVYTTRMVVEGGSQGLIDARFGQFITLDGEC